MLTVKNNRVREISLLQEDTFEEDFLYILCFCCLTLKEAAGTHLLKEKKRCMKFCSSSTEESKMQQNISPERNKKDGYLSWKSNAPSKFTYIVVGHPIYLALPQCAILNSFQVIQSIVAKLKKALGAR